MVEVDEDGGWADVYFEGQIVRLDLLDLQGGIAPCSACDGQGVVARKGPLRLVRPLRPCDACVGKGYR